MASDEGSISRIPEAIFSYLNRNAVHEERRYGMPTEQIVEIGTQIDFDRIGAPRLSVFPSRIVRSARSGKVGKFLKNCQILVDSYGA